MSSSDSADGMGDKQRKALEFFREVIAPSLYHLSESDDDDEWTDESYDDDDSCEEDDGDSWEDDDGGPRLCACGEMHELSPGPDFLDGDEYPAGKKKKKAVRKKVVGVEHLRAALMNVSPWDSYPIGLDTAALDKAIRKNFRKSVDDFVKTLETKRSKVMADVHIPEGLPNVLWLYVNRCFHKSSINLLLTGIERFTRVLDGAKELEEFQDMLYQDPATGPGRVIDPEIVRELITLMWKYSAMAYSADKLLILFNQCVKVVEQDFVEGPVYLRKAADQSKALEKLSKCSPPSVTASPQVFFDIFWLLYRIRQNTSSSALQFDSYFPLKERNDVRETIHRYLVSCCRLRLDELLKSIVPPEEDKAPDVRPELRSYLQKNILPAVKKYLQAKKTRAESPEKNNPALSGEATESEKATALNIIPAGDAKTSENVPTTAVKLARAIEALEARNLTVSMTDPPEFVNWVMDHTLKLVDLIDTVDANGYVGTEKDSLKNIRKTIKAFPIFLLSIGRALNNAVKDGTNPIIPRAKEVFLKEWEVAEKQYERCVNVWLKLRKSCTMVDLLEKLRQEPAFSHLSMEILMRDSGVVSHFSKGMRLGPEEVRRMIDHPPVLEKFAMLFTTSKDFELVA